MTSKVKAPPVPVTVELWMHTAKAVRRNSAISVCPEDRVFLVMATKTPENKSDWGTQPMGTRSAWKCSLTKKGLVHPAFKTVLKFTEEDLKRGLLWRGRNGSEPTAVFKPDSFYRKLTLEELKQLAQQTQD